MHDGRLLRGNPFDTFIFSSAAVDIIFHAIENYCCYFFLKKKKKKLIDDATKIIYYYYYYYYY
jgi:hypothetical protein